MTEIELWHILNKKKKQIVSKKEAINFVYEFRNRRSYRFFFNGKKIKKRKLIVILKNNIPEKYIEIRFSEKILPFYKGDYNYFCCNYGASGLSRLVNSRYYLKVLEK